QTINNISSSASFRAEANISFCCGEVRRLDLKIPSVFGDSWTLATDEIRFFPSRSLFYNDAINKLLKKFRNYK
ncbi:Hypothetical protein FKW44_011749, partial [Caligus rogercresseyi]